MIILGLGSNLSSKLGNRFKNIEAALTYLEKNRIKVLKKSSFYETPSYPDKKYPKFINIVAAVKTDLKPLDLMLILLSIEKKLGSFLLAEAIKESFLINAKRVWAHTCTLDHNNALKNYLSRGMKIYYTENLNIKSA